MGAGVALNFAIRYPPRVAGLTKEWLPTDPEFQRIERISRDNAASIRRQLERADIRTMITLLESLPADSPGPVPEAWREVTVPTLVIVNRRDVLHPMEYGERLAAGIARARLVEITAKELDPMAHAREATTAIEQFVALLGGQKANARRSENFS